MNLTDAILRFSERSFPYTVGNILTALVFVMLLILGAVWIAPPCWMAPPAVIALVIMLALLNRCAFMQIVYEGHGARAFGNGKYAEAEVYFRKSWARAQLLLPTDPARSRVLRWLTLATQAQGNYDDTETFALDWLAQSEKALGANHPNTLVAMNALADVYTTLARYGQALPLLEKIVMARETRKLKEPLEYADALDALGFLWLSLRRPDSAEPYFRQAFEVVNQHLESSSREALRICGHFCLIRVLTRPDEAETLAESALAHAEKTWPESMTNADCLGVLATVQRFQDRFSDAERLLRRSLGIRKKCHPLNLMVTHQDLCSLAIVLRYQGHWADAEECFCETLRLRDKYLAPTDLAIAYVLEDYAELLDLMNRAAEADTLRQRARQIRDFHSQFRIV